MFKAIPADRSRHGAAALSQSSDEFDGVLDMSHSPRVVRCGLIQCSNPINDEARPVAEIQKAML